MPDDTSLVSRAVQMDKTRPFTEASFMGVAVEIRLQIYGYLLTPYWTRADIERLKKDCHCCGDHHGRDQDGEGIACSCTLTHIVPQILATNKQIFNEAVPILYERMELRLRLRHPRTFSLGYSPPLETATSKLPPYGSEYITRVVMVCDRDDAVGAHRNPNWAWQYYIREYCKKMSTIFPHLQRVRINFKGQLYEGAPATLATAFARIASLPALRSVIIEAWDLDLCQTIEARIRSEAQSLGKDVEILLVHSRDWAYRLLA